MNENTNVSEKLSLYEDEKTTFTFKMSKKNVKVSVLETKGFRLEKEPGSS